MAGEYFVNSNKRHLTIEVLLISINLLTGCHRDYDDSDEFKAVVRGACTGCSINVSSQETDSHTWSFK